MKKSCSVWQTVPPVNWSPPATGPLRQLGFHSNQFNGDFAKVTLSLTYNHFVRPHVQVFWFVSFSVNKQNGGCSSVVERSLCMWKARGSIPRISSAVVAEWLRRWTWNPMGSARVGSNPANCDSLFAFFLNNQNRRCLLWGLNPRPPVYETGALPLS